MNTWNKPRKVTENHEQIISETIKGTGPSTESVQNWIRRSQGRLADFRREAEHFERSLDRRAEGTEISITLTTDQLTDLKSDGVTLPPEVDVKDDQDAFGHGDGRVTLIIRRKDTAEISRLAAICAHRKIPINTCEPFCAGQRNDITFPLTEPKQPRAKKIASNVKDAMPKVDLTSTVPESDEEFDATRPEVLREQILERVRQEDSETFDKAATEAKPKKERKPRVPKAPGGERKVRAKTLYLLDPNWAGEFTGIRLKIIVALQANEAPMTREAISAAAVANNNSVGEALGKLVGMGIVKKA